MCEFYSNCYNLSSVTNTTCSLAIDDMHQNFIGLKFGTFDHTKVIQLLVFCVCPLIDDKNHLISLQEIFKLLEINNNYWYMVSGHPLSCNCTQEVAKHRRGVKVTRGDN